MACEGLGQSPLPLRGPACIAGKLGLGEKQSYQSQLLRQPLKRGQGSSSFTAHALGCAQRRRCPQGFTASTAAPRCHRVPFCVPRCRSGSGEGRGARACRSREGRPGCLAQSTAQASGRGRFQDPLSTSGTRDSLMMFNAKHSEWAGGVGPSFCCRIGAHLLSSMQATRRRGRLATRDPGARGVIFVPQTS